MTFFWRIFLSAWAIVLITLGVTVGIAGWLPGPGNASGSTLYLAQSVRLLASAIDQEFQRNPATAADVLRRDYVLDFSPIVVVFVIDPDGQDILGRPLPAPVAAAVGKEAGTVDTSNRRIMSGRLHVRPIAYGGFTVIGYEGYFPFAHAMVKPGARWLLVGLLVLVSAGVSLLLARFIVLPVRRLQQAEQQVAAGDLSVRVAPSLGGRTDDIAKLAREFDVMTERVAALLQSQQRIMRDVSHELRSPLARLQALLSISRQSSGPGEDEQLTRMERELERLDTLIGEILTFARLETTEVIDRRPTDLVDLLQNIVDDASLEGQHDNKEVCFEGPSRQVVNVDSALLQRALENIIRNAIKFTAADSAVVVRLATQGDQITIAVDDRGPGVPRTALDAIFEPFFRVGDARSTRSGTGGIGLAIAARSVRLHGGTISACNRPGGGLRIAVSLPAAT